MLVTRTGDVVEESSYHFELLPLIPPPDFVNVHFISETASRLLFLTMQWTRTVRPFTMLQ